MPYTHKKASDLFRRTCNSTILNLKEHSYCPLRFNYFILWQEYYHFIFSLDILKSALPFSFRHAPMHFTSFATSSVDERKKIRLILCHCKLLDSILLYSFSRDTFYTNTKNCIQYFLEHNFFN